MGRSVAAWGYWGDCLNSPYHCWGTVCEDPGFLKFSNKQFVRTAVDIAEHNVLVGGELRLGPVEQGAQELGQGFRQGCQELGQELGQGSRQWWRQHGKC